TRLCLTDHCMLCATSSKELSLFEAPTALALKVIMRFSRLVCSLCSGVYTRPV
ncbi:hypothetical protein BgiMline_003338, partial [Biomphalaria glabrata]